MRAQVERAALLQGPGALRGDGAARACCTRAQVDHTAMMYPSYKPYTAADSPNVLHYGLLFEVAGTGFKFDKHWYMAFDALACPPSGVWGHDRFGRPTGGLFPHPPNPLMLTSQARRAAAPHPCHTLAPPRLPAVLNPCCAAARGRRPPSAAPVPGQHHCLTCYVRPHAWSVRPHGTYRLADTRPAAGRCFTRR